MPTAPAATPTNVIVGGAFADGVEEAADAILARKSMQQVSVGIALQFGTARSRVSHPQYFASFCVPVEQDAAGSAVARVAFLQ